MFSLGWNFPCGYFSMIGFDKVNFHDIISDWQFSAKPIIRRRNSTLGGAVFALLAGFARWKSQPKLVWEECGDDLHGKQVLRAYH